MKNVLYYLVCLVLFLSCEVDTRINYITEFVFVNNTKHQVEIEHTSWREVDYKYTIAPNSSHNMDFDTREYYGLDVLYGQTIQLSFNQSKTLEYNRDKASLNNPYFDTSYRIVKKADDHFIYTYEITDGDYDRAVSVE